MQKYPIPKNLQIEISSDPSYSVCARKGLHSHECGGRLTKEHAMTYAGRRLNEKFAIISLCAKAHSVDEYQDGGDLDKEINLWIALNRATDDELLAISKAIPYIRERARLNAIYGVYVPPALPLANKNQINYGLQGKQRP